MCGICGYISKNEYSEDIITTMNDEMIHRGPDDRGVLLEKLSDGRQLALGHRRLSILDLSMAGHQPMSTDNGNVSIIYNGEIYNFMDVRRELETLGYSFSSHCDTEVVLKAYEAYGIDFLNKISGMFAIAIIDRRDESLILARDRMGKKPLYYYQDGDNFAFGSELKCIMKFPEFKKNVRKELVASYLVNQCVDSPNTIFENTYKLEAGEYLVYKAGKLNKATYYSMIDVAENGLQNQEEDYDTAKKILRELLLESVSKRMVADVPVGTFLSGGIDSTLVTALARETTDKKLKTFTIGFNTTKDNEAQYAKEIASHLGTDHKELYVSDEDLFSQMQNIIKYYDEPFSDSSQVATMLVSKLARENVTVVLTGDGGDEIFCGYDEYDSVAKLQKLDGLGGLAYGAMNFPLIRSAKLSSKLPYTYRGIVENRDNRYKTQVFLDERIRVTNKLINGDSISAKREYESLLADSKLIAGNWQLRRMMLDMRHYLADEVLQKVDRASMKYSLEVRCPILDQKVVEYGYQIPHKYKYHNGEKKYILKQLAYDMVPREMLDRPKKGFGVPVKLWLCNELSDKLATYARPEILLRQNIFNADEIAVIIDKMKNDSWWFYDQVVWGFLIFQMWYQEYVEDLWK